MPDIALAITDVLMPHTAAALAGLHERAMWRLMWRSEFPGPAIVNLGGKRRAACFLKAEVAAWEAGNQLPQQTGRAAREAHKRGMAEVA
jgi:hypothetical protein